MPNGIALCADAKTTAVMMLRNKGRYHGASFASKANARGRVERDRRYAKINAIHGRGKTESCRARSKAKNVCLSATYRERQDDTGGC